MRNAKSRSSPPHPSNLSSMPATRRKSSCRSQMQPRGACRMHDTDVHHPGLVERTRVRGEQIGVGEGPGELAPPWLPVGLDDYHAKPVARIGLAIQRMEAGEQVTGT